MKKPKNSLLFIVLLISGLLFTGAGYAGEDSIYSSYTKADGWMTPEVSLVFQGWKDGVYPWDLFGGKHRAATVQLPDRTDSEESLASGMEEENQGNGQEASWTVSGSEIVNLGDLSGNGLSGNGLSGNALSEENVMQDVSGNGAEHALQGNDSDAGGNVASQPGPRYDKFGQLIEEPSQEGAGQQEGTMNPEAEAGDSQEALQEGSAEEDALGQDLETVIQERLDDKTYEPGPVTEDYFNDALFIGDSRTVGLDEYGGFQEETTFFAATSLTIYQLFDSPKEFASLADGTKATLEEALQERQFGKIYLMLGINELGRGTTESFFTVYADAVNRIRQLQPNAIIFVQGIMRVSGQKSETDPVFNNVNINERNQALAAMADNQTIFYLEVNDVLCDENGDLIADYTYDQIPLKAKYYQIWKDYLFAHGVIRQPDV